LPARAVHWQHVTNPDITGRTHRGNVTMSKIAPLIRHTLLAALSALTLSVVAAPTHAQASQGNDTGKVAPSGVVNVNSASAEELERLPGIGPSRSQAILELRTKMKRFQTVEDLMRVKGIGRASLRNLRPMITLDGPTTLAAQGGKRSTPKPSAPSAE
jgi:comEA protein